jgi:hypothetical protein
VIQAAPNDIARIKSATEATAQEALVSTEPEWDCNIGGKLDWRTLLQAAPNFTTHIQAGLLYVLRCVKMREPPPVAIPF